MDVTSLNYFISTYEKKSVTNAAKTLHITQQGLSKAIQSLEGELGVPLFERTNAGVRPTSYAELVYAHSLQVLQELEKMKQAITLLSQADDNCLRIGIAHAVVAPLHLEVPLASFAAQYQDIHLETRSEPDEHCEELLSDRKLDIAFVMGPLASKRFVSEILSCEYICAVMKRSHPLTGKCTLCMEDLLDERLICIGENSRGYQVLSKWFSERNLNLPRLIPSSEFKINQAMVEQGAGILLTPEHLAREMSSNGNIVSVPIDEFYLREIFMCYPPQKPLKESVKTFFRI